MIFIGIDPGLFGAVAIIDGATVSIHDTPVAKTGKKSDYIPAAMAAILSDLRNAYCVIEAVHALPGQGVTSMFNFGKGFGLWLGILAGLRIPHTKVTPQAWKKQLMAGMGDKAASRIRACELYPGCAGQLSRVKDHGRAEALLLAHYGLIQFGGDPLGG